jgi:hypothetical protein
MVLVQFLVSDYVGNKTGGDLFDIDFQLNEKQLNNKEIRIGKSNTDVKVFISNCSFF